MLPLKYISSCFISFEVFVFVLIIFNPDILWFFVSKNFVQVCVLNPGLGLRARDLLKYLNKTKNESKIAQRHLSYAIFIIVYFLWFICMCAIPCAIPSIFLFLFLFSLLLFWYLHFFFIKGKK